MYKGTGDLDDDEKEISFKDVLLSLMNSDDLELKTEIHNPKDLAGLNIFGMDLKTEKAPQSSKTIESFINVYLKYMVSFERKSRTELIKAIQSLLEKESKTLSISDRMTTNLKK